MDEIKPKRVINRMKMGGGVTLLALAAAGGCLDMINNVRYGADKHWTIAGTLVIAAIILVFLPCVMKNKWDLHFGFMLVVAGGLTVFAGYQNHMATQKNHALHEAATTKAYNDAQGGLKAAEQEYAKAQAAFDAIGEQMGSAELKVIYDKAVADVDAESKPENGGCSLKKESRCQKAKTLAEVTLPRVAAAKAKEAAKIRADEALARADKIRGAAPQQAKAATMSESEELAFAIFLLLASVGSATFAHRGWELCQEAISIEAAPKAKKPAPVKKEAPAQPAIEKRKDIAAYIVGCTVACEKGADGEYAEAAELGAKFYADFKSWWAMHNPGQTVPHSTSFGTAMGRAHDKIKTKGQQHYYAKITDWRPAKPNLEKVA